MNRENKMWGWVFLASILGLLGLSGWAVFAAAEWLASRL